MAAGEIHLNDIGILFKSTIIDQDGVPVNVAAANLVQFRFERPDGTMLIVPAYLITDGVDGKVGYMSEDGDLNQIGSWQYQIYIELGPNKKTTDISKFKVKPNLPV